MFAWSLFIWSLCWELFLHQYFINILQLNHWFPFDNPNQKILQTMDYTIYKVIVKLDMKSSLICCKILTTVDIESTINWMAYSKKGPSDILLIFERACAHMHRFHLSWTWPSTIANGQNSIVKFWRPFRSKPFILKLKSWKFDGNTWLPSPLGSCDSLRVSSILYWVHLWYWPSSLTFAFEIYWFGYRNPLFILLFHKGSYRAWRN